MSILTILLVVVLNLAARHFLRRFFYWNDKNTKLLDNWFSYFLLVPPVALVIAIFLVILGLILKILQVKTNK